MTPKQPYLDWANRLDEDGVKIGQRRITWIGLADALMGVGLVEIDGVFGYDVPQMAFTQDEH